MSLHVEKRRLIEDEEETSSPKRVNQQPFRMTDSRIEKEIDSHPYFKSQNTGGYCLYPASMLDAEQYKQICDLIGHKVKNENVFYSPALQRKIVEGRCNMLKINPETLEFEICFRQTGNPNEFFCGYHKHKNTDQKVNDLIQVEIKRLEDIIYQLKEEAEQKITNLFTVCNFLFEEYRKIIEQLNSQKEEIVYIKSDS